MERGQVNVVVDVASKGAMLGDLYGIFFEDINHAADGGLYGELLRNGSFEFSEIDHPSYNGMTAWRMIQKGGARCAHSIQCTRALNNQNPHYLVLDVLEIGEEVGIQNEGYNTGVFYQEGEIYKWRGYVATTKGETLTLDIVLEDEDNGVVASKRVEVEGDTWQLLTADLVASKTSAKGRLTIKVQSVGRLYLDHVSLFPRETFNQRENGMRKDIAQMLQALTPKFMRFPGGCLVHDGSLNAEDRDSLYRWKRTLGRVEERPSRRNNWRYNQSLGLGYYEYFLFCEDIGAKPLPVLPAGYDPHHQRKVPFEVLDEWIEEALDLIEFANGSLETKWGQVRAELGHPEPFNLEYLAIGNEEVGEGFFARYPYFHRGIKVKYPEIKLINSSGPFAAGSEYENGWESARVYHSDYVDEHYYQTPEWFLANHHRYDTFREEGPKVFLGEYASWGNTWYNALVEASFMVGLERNASKVGLACYAPLLCNVDYVNWKPDMIWFNNHQVFGTPNYYVQKLFMNYQGDYQLGYRVENLPKPKLKDTGLSGMIALAPQADTVIEYSDIQITNEDTGIVHLVEGVYQLTADAKVKELGVMHAKNYTVTLKGKKLEGRRGFCLQFARQDNDHKGNWELGGWQNMDSIVTKDQSGRNACLTQSLFTVAINETYDLRLEVRENRITTFVNGEKLNEIEDLPVQEEALYSVASQTKEGKTIIKLVNVQDNPIRVQVTLENGEVNTSQIVEAHIMSGYDLQDENSFEIPMKVAPYIERFEISDLTFSYEVSAHSIHILVI